MGDSFLDAATSIAFDKLCEAGGDPLRLADPYRTVAIITAAQGVIDNGGLRYLFEGDWPGHPPYEVFSDAYRVINATAEADAIDAAAAALDVAQPESHAEERAAFLSGAGGARIDDLNATMTSDVWALLASYVEEHRGAFS